MRNRKINRLFIWLLAFLMLVEPILLPVLRAEEVAGPSINTSEVDGLIDLDEIVAPADYLDQMMKLRGATKDDAEARAWGEWMMMLNSTFVQLDDGASDVFSFYEAMKMLRENSTILADISEVVKSIARFTTLGFSFMFRSRLLSQSTNLILGFMRLTNMAQAAQTWVDSNRILDFMEFTAPPPCWNNPEVAGQGFKSYWRWVQKKAGNTSVTSELTDSRGVARSLGVGLVIVGLAIDSWGIIRSEDRQVDRTSYSLSKHYVGAALGLASLVAMFCTPLIGQIVLIGGLVWAIVAITGDLIGAYNKRWKDAYKNSYWYLYENDPEFRSYYDNRAKLKEEEKSVSLRLVAKRYEEFKVAEPQEGNTPEARNSRVYIALEKQGVLMSYYARKGFSLPDFDLERLKSLWQMKADFMSWKPSESEAREVKTGGFWAKVGQTLNPVTWAGWVGDGAKSADYKKAIEEYNLQKVFFNPDYVLIKKYLNFTTAQKLEGGIYDAVGMRIEQSPFNYAPLIGIDQSTWNEDLLKESLLADSFQIGQKELVYLREQVKSAADQVEAFIEKLDETVGKIDRKDLPQATRIRKYLEELVKAYNSAPTRADAQLFARGARIFGWTRNKISGDVVSPETIISSFKEDIEKSLLYEPLSLAQKAVEAVLLLTTIKQQLDMAALMRSYLTDKAESLQSFNQTFKTREIVLFLKEGTFLDVKGSTISDWFSQLYSSYEETDKQLQLLTKEVTRFTGFAGNANSSSRSRFLWFDKEITHPTELLARLNSELASWKKAVDSWSEIAEKAELQVALAEKPEFAARVFKEFKLAYELEALDPAKPINEKSSSEDLQ